MREKNHFNQFYNAKTLNASKNGPRITLTELDWELKPILQKISLVPPHPVCVGSKITTKYLITFCFLLTKVALKHSLKSQTLYLVHVYFMRLCYGEDIWIHL